jgi:helicase
MVERLNLAQIELDQRVRDELQSRGLSELWPAQSSALLEGLLDGRSLVVSAPTSSGKTLIAEILMTSRLLKEGGKAVYLVPLRALASQKLDELRRWETVGLKIASSTGDFDRYDRWLSDYDIIIMTYEKCDALLRRRDQIGWLRDIQVVIADEIHLVGDPGRGPNLEVVLTRFKLINPEIQFLALSATISNADDLAEWLGAKLVKSDWRPVPLLQGVFYDGAIYYENGEVKEISGNVMSGDPLALLCADTLNEGGQVLVFASTRRQAVSMARKLSSLALTRHSHAKALMEISRSIRRADDATPLTEELSEILVRGVGFHHAGLPSTARTALEKAFKDRTLRVLVSTTTLAAGLNLPARRVIIPDLMRYEFGYGRQPIPVLEYHQMAGRAGRPGLDEKGEAVVIVRRRQEIEEMLDAYARAEPERLEPNLVSEQAMLPHTLSALASGYAKDEPTLLDFYKKTFSGKMSSELAIRNPALRSLSYLIQNGFIANYGGSLLPTPLGKKTNELYLHPVTAVLVKRASETNAWSSQAKHLLHLVCLPMETPKVRTSTNERESLSYEVDEAEEELPVSLEDYVDVTEDFSHDPYDDYVAAWKGANVLEAWCNETPESVIEERFGVQPGDLYQLYNAAAWVARGISSLLQTLRVDRRISLEYGKLSIRVEYGVKEDIIPLLSLRGIGRVRGRVLYKMGLKNLDDVAKAPVEQIAEIRGITTTMAARIKEEASRLTSSS